MLMEREKERDNIHITMAALMMVIKHIVIQK